MFRDSLTRRGLRLAFAVTLGLTVEATRGAVLPFLAPVIALQLLAASPVPPPARLVVMLLAIGGGTGLVALAVASLTLAVPGAYGIGVGLLYMWSFAMCFMPKLRMVGTLVLTVSIVVTALSAASTLVALAILTELLMGIVGGVALVVLAHAVFPNPPGFQPAQRAAAATSEVPLPPHVRAAMATAVILPLHLWITSDGVAAMVILMTTATMLRQPGIAQSRRYALGFAISNGLGGVLAAVSAVLYALQPELPMLAALVGATSLYLAGRLLASQRWAPVFLPGFVAYVILFGLTLSVLPLGSDVAVVTRVLQIVGAALYAMAAVSLLVPLFLRWAPPSGRAAA